MQLIHKRVLLAWGLALCVPLFVWAQLPSLSFENLTTREGLPSNTVLCATSDQQGFMWFGTRRCPVRYDGTTFKSLLSPETNFVSGLAVDKHNQIWASTDLAGVCSINTRTMQLEEKADSYTPDSPETGHFFIDSSGQGWYSDRDGINRRDMQTGKVKHYSFRKTTFVWIKGSFVEDKNHTVWVIGSDNGLFRYDRRTDKLVCVLGADCADKGRREDILFTKGCLGSDGMLWIGTYNRGLYRFDPQTGKYTNFLTTHLAGNVTCVEEGTDENGQRLLWIGTQQGLGVFRPHSEKFYFFKDALPAPFWVYHIYRNQADGIVWVCTSDGILKYHPQSNLFHTVLLPTTLAARKLTLPVNVHAFLADQTDSSGNTFWLGLSHTGMIRWKRTTNEFTLVPVSPEGSSPEIRWMVQRPDGTIWLGVNRWGYQGHGLMVYDPGKGCFIETPFTKLANRYYSVPFYMYGFFDRQQRLWIGNSDEGIHVLDEKTVREVTPWDNATQKALLRNNNLINDMQLDAQGRVWLATYQGLYLADEKNRRFILVDTLRKSTQPLDPSVNSVLPDGRGNVWAARWGSITKTTPDDSVQTILSTHTTLADRENRGMAQDTWGNIWVGNYEGLLCYFPTMKRSLRFTVSDGLLSNNTLSYLYMHRGKELFIGQKNGFSILPIHKLTKPYNPPRMAISSFAVHGQERILKPNEPVRLTRNDNTFSVDFVALNYKKIPDNQYAYYLEGLDKTWNYSGNAHQVYYTNLAPGNYTLHLKVGDAFGNWSLKPLHLRVEVLPAYYETWWFRLLLIGLIIGLLYALYRYRIGQLLHLQRVRNRISADLHDELGASLSGISIMGMMAQQQLPNLHPSRSFLERMMEETHQISSSLDDIVWSINPKNDELTSLVARMTRYASELLEAREIDYQMEIPKQALDGKLSMEQRRDFYLFFKESVTNLVKHARCTHANIEIAVKHHRLRLVIQDDGVGFDLAARTDRNGLQNLRKRAENLKGVLHIASSPGNGTRIQLEFSLPD